MHALLRCLLFLAPSTAGLHADDPKQRRPDIALAKKYLKWEPTVPLAEGLKKTIAYFRAKV